MCHLAHARGFRRCHRVGVPVGRVQCCNVLHPPRARRIGFSLIGLGACWPIAYRPRPYSLPLFSGVRGRGILRSSLLALTVHRQFTAYSSLMHRHRLGCRRGRAMLRGSFPFRMFPAPFLSVALVPPSAYKSSALEAPPRLPSCFASSRSERSSVGRRSLDEGPRGPR